MIMSHLSSLHQYLPCYLNIMIILSYENMLSYYAL